MVARGAVGLVGGWVGRGARGRVWCGVGRVRDGFVEEATTRTIIEHVRECGALYGVLGGCLGVDETAVHVFVYFICNFEIKAQAKTTIEHALRALYGVFGWSQSDHTACPRERHAVWSSFFSFCFSDKCAESYPSDLAVLRHGLRLFSGLAVDPDSVKALVASGGVELVQPQQTIRTHPSDLDIQRYGLGALQNFAVEADNKLVVIASGGLELGQQMMRTHPSDLDIQRDGLGVLGN